MTLKAVRILRQCQVIAAPATIKGRMLALEIASANVNMAEKTVLPLRLSMTKEPEQRRAECNPGPLSLNNPRGSDIIPLLCMKGDGDMRCSCKECGTYMIQAESDHLGCVCPDCGYRCNDCLGTDTVVSRDRLKELAFDRRFDPENLAASFEQNEDEEWSDDRTMEP